MKMDAEPEKFDGFDPAAGMPRESALQVIVDICQEYDCPNGGMDYDLNDADIVFEGESFYCPICWSNHIAGKDVEINQSVKFSTGKDEYWPLAKDAEEKAKWLAAVARNTRKT